MSAYVAGLIATIFAMNIFEAAQPALIYLVPFCLLTVMGLALAKGELKEVWDYTEEDEEADDKEKDAKSKDAKDGAAEGITTEATPEGEVTETKKDM